jgi:vitamin B12 transporter
MKFASVDARLLVPGFALSVVFSAGVRAQESLAPIVVTATRVEQSLSDVLPSVTVISRAEIERSQAPTLVDLIQGQPGIEIGRNGGPGTPASIFMRGQNSASVAVFIDGVRVQTDAIGGLKLVDITPSQIEKIEILRGNMGAVYGEAATGGVIHIFTRSGVGLSGPTASFSYGSRNTSDVALGYNLKSDDFRVGVTVQRFDTEGYSAMNANQNVKVNPDKDGYKRESVFLNAEKSLSKDWSIGLQANQVDGNVQYDSGNSWDKSSDTHNFKQQTSDLTFYSNFKPTPDWSAKLGLTDSSYKYRQLNNNIAEDWAQLDGAQRTMQWANAYQSNLGNVTFGVDATQANFKASNEFNRDTLSYYLGLSGLYQRWDFQANARYDEIRAKVATTSIDKSATTWLMGLGYWVMDDLKLTGLASTSFRAPAAGELFDIPAWGTKGNASLQPEEHAGYELGFSYKLKNGNWRLVRFVTETKNAIGYIVSENTYENISKVENQGFELSLDGVTNSWRYKLSAVIQDPKDLIKNERLARRAKEYGSFQLDKSAWGIDWGTKVTWSGERKDSGFNNFYNSAYVVYDFYAAKKITPEWTGRVKLENAFDQQYQLAYGYNAVPRGLFFTLQYQPK